MLELILPISMEELMTPNHHVGIVFVTGTGKAVEVELTYEGAVVGMLEVLGQVLLCKGGLIVYEKSITVGREGEDAGIDFGYVGY